MEVSVETSFDVQALKRDFPVLHRELPGGKRLVYLDNAATSQKPVQVLGAMDAFYRERNANVHRAVYSLAAEATKAYEGVRRKAASFIGASSAQEIVFTSGTTAAINLVAFSWACSNLREGDGVLLTQMEHHSNIVPWQALAREKKLALKFIPLTSEGRLDLSSLDELLEGVKLVSLSHASNVLGSVNDVAFVARKAHSAGALVLVDGAQSVPHFPVDVRELGVDFLAFSGHKLLGPTGTGVLWARRELLEEMPPVVFGGDMIREVSFSQASWNDVPWKFEAGTGNIGGVVGLGAAFDYLNGVGLRRVEAHEKKLTDYALERLGSLDGVTIYGPLSSKDRVGVVSFNLRGVHAHDLASVLDAEGVAIRSGHHCAMPLMGLLGVPATARASFYLYNSFEDIDALVGGIGKARELFGV